MSRRLGPDPPPPPADPDPLADVLARLAAILPRLAEALEQGHAGLRIERVTLRIDELAEAMGISRRALEREKSAGRLPRPDLHVGKVPLWRRATIDAWLSQQANGHGRRS